MPLKKDTITPWLERTKRELETLWGMDIRVGIQSGGDQFDKEGKRVEGADAKLLTIAFVHEFGAEIHPRHAKNLAIPLCKEADGKSPGDFTDLHTIKSAEGHMFLVREPGKGQPKKTYSGKKSTPKTSTAAKRDYKHQDDTDELEFLFLLLPSVSIPERSFIRAGFDTGKATLEAAYKHGISMVVSGQWTGEEAAQHLGAMGVAMIQDYIYSGSLKEKSDITKETTKAANTPLYSTGVLYHSITYQIERKK
ncbi:MAG: hypothetical protein LBB75_06505 [Oscillospiraceae bacterium]|jgi:hypothetical protein|nr:hypothetical protein [Oscillospiraceae bacterium]